MTDVKVRLTRREIQKRIPKTERIEIRVTEESKRSIEATAKKCRLTVTEYLEACHRLVADKLQDKGSDS